MPLIKMEVSPALSDDDQRTVVKALSKIAAEAIGKPESYVMATVSPAQISMAGEVGPAAFLDIRSIGGLSQAVNREISKQVCALLKERLDIPEDRVYLSFANVTAQDWGWRSGTFG